MIATLVKAHDELKVFDITPNTNPFGLTKKKIDIDFSYYQKDGVIN